MKKRGQAFIITAVIFIAIVSTLLATHNFSKKTEFSTFPYVAEEIKIESEKVMDYVLINDDYSSINTFTQDISNFAKKEEIDIYFIDDNRCYNSDGKGCSSTINGDKITATIDGTEYSFPKYDSGKHFYFVMIKEKGGEKYVYTNT